MATGIFNLLLGLILMALVAPGCEKKSESESARRPSVVRKKIVVAKGTTPQVAKPARPSAAAGKTIKRPIKPLGKPQILAKKTQGKVVEPKAVSQPPLKQPEAPPALKPAKAEPASAKKKPAVETAKEKPPAKPVEQKVPVQPGKKKPPVQVAKKKPGVQPDEKKPAAKPGSQLLAKGIGKKPGYFYDPEGKLDPFRPLFATEAERLAPTRAKAKRLKPKVPLTPLQRLDIGQLKLVGVIIAPTGNKALVEEPSGKGYIVSSGTYVGRNFGKVKRILKDRIVVEEQVEDFLTGQMKLQATELALQKKVGGV